MKIITKTLILLSIFFKISADFACFLRWFMYNVTLMIDNNKKDDNMYKTLIKYNENNEIKTFEALNEVDTNEKTSVDNVINKYLINNLTIANLVAIETYEVA